VQDYEGIDIGVVTGIAAALVLWSLALSVLALRRMEDEAARGGLKWLFATNVAFLTGTAALLAREALPFWASAGLVVAGAHVGILAGHAAVLRGLGGRPDFRRIAPIAGVVIGLQAALAAVAPGIAALFLTSSLINGILSAWIAWSLWPQARPLGRAQAYLATLPFAALALAYLMRLPVLAVPGAAGAVMVSTLLIAFLLAFSALQWCFALISFAAARLNRRLRIERARADEASRLKSQFLSTMSHELRTPLNGILGMAEVLGTDLPEGRGRDMATTIRRSGEDLLCLLTDILDLSQLEAGHLVPAAVPFVPARLLEAAAQQHRPVAQARGLALVLRIEPGLEGARLGDPARIGRVLEHLLANAIKFTATGTITIEGRTIPGAARDGVRLMVLDTGIGMNAAQRARVFDAFVQAEGGTSRRHGGTGLGLALVRRLVERMGGAIQLDSAPSRGTRVQVDLPLPRAAATRTEPAAMPHPPAPRAPVPEPPPTAPATEVASPLPLAGLRLLLAEDNVTNQRVISAFLAGSGARLTVVANGRLAVERVAADAAAGRPPFDLFLFDVAMPEMDGPTALRRIRAATGTQSPPAIVVTANVEADRLADYRAAGFVECLAKPLRKQELLSSLARHAAPVEAPRV
jgi:signal transduction histidine kinase/BarA-like signal transduction histidine kinase